MAQYADLSSSQLQPGGLVAPKMTMPAPKSTRASVFGQFRFETLQYMTTLPEAKSLTTSQFLSGRITATSFNRDRGSLNWAADLSAGTFFSLKQSYYSVQEVYASMPLDENSEISVGRKKYNWTEIDRVWSMGLWQPKYAIDALRPEDQGLTGAFFDYKKDNFQILAFGSTVFIPTMGPDVREEGGSIKSDSRWYRPPSKQSGKISITYKIDQGDLWKLVNQDSFALRMQGGNDEKGPWVAAATGRKPINDLLLERLVTVDPSVKANVVVSPKVGHHKVFSADAGYRWDNVKASVSYFEDEPELQLPEEDYAIQQFDPLRVYSAQVEWSMKEILSRTLLFQVAYLKAYGDKIQDIEYDGAVSEIRMFDYRYRFTNAAMGKVVGPLTSIYGRPLVTKISYTYDFDQRGSIFGTEFQYQWNRAWSFLLGADILGSDSKDSTSTGFINSYRANDRAYAGASYVF